MKKINYIYGLLLSILLVGCNGEFDAPLYKGDANRVSFASTAQKNTLQKEGDLLKVPLYRGNSDADQQVEVELTYAEEETTKLLKLKDNFVTFKKGENIAYIDVDYGTIDDLGITTHTATLSVKDKNLVSTDKVSVGIGKVNISVKRQLTYKEFWKNDGFFSSEFFDAEWDQPLLLAEEGNVVMLPDCYVKGFGIAFLMDENFENVLQFSKQETGYVHSTYGMVSVEYVDSEKIGNELYLYLKYTVKAGSFGVAEEILTFPTE